ncbi:MAG: M23 family metallopeptidase [Candidatus Margulisbacteria bacterium]|nr:M23 family metallopeptidase [Candidatus Margulisiibacteriota bacterium]
MENKSKKKQRFYTFVIVPHDASRRPLTIKAPVFAIYSVLFLVVFSTLFVASSFVYSSYLTRRLVNYHQALNKNRQQREAINSFTQKTKQVELAIQELVDQDNKLRKLLGLSSWKSKAKLASNLVKYDDKAEQVSNELAQADMELADRSKSLSELRSWVNKIRERYANTPSRWPLHGRIVSRFGYRIYPWRGFHTGIDISGNYGSPIRSTADGVVSFVGWRTGYGKTVIVEHGYGKSTLYAHCSRYAVSHGQKVSKGQVVSYVGNTGYTTGPHLHYEVRTANRPVNPSTYLNLNILSASKIWKE